MTERGVVETTTEKSGAIPKSRLPRIVKNVGVFVNVKDRARPHGACGRRELNVHPVFLLQIDKHL